ncbi:hypothetical protein [Streptomyces sp. NPDC048349]|uniref:hypothetical protein n=1 Tax=Streptomyces sp. NPDC048349 TaxID=3155486 RepID=UPI00344A51A8
MNDPYAIDVLAVSAPSGLAERRAARRTAAAHAADSEELEVLLDMLGLHPDHDPATTGGGGAPLRPRRP